MNHIIWHSNSIKSESEPNLDADYPSTGVNVPRRITFLKDEAMSHAKNELGLYKKRKKIESLGHEYDEEALASGEYDYLLIED